MSEAPVLNEVDQWLQRGAELRRQLLAEREQLAARLAEIDAKLKRMPSDGPAKASSGPSQRTLNGVHVRALPQDAPVPDLVVAILEAHPEGLAAPDIVLKAQELRPKIDPRNVHSALQRSKRVQRNGKARKYVYTVAPEEGDAA